jgi:hypothetical protein
MNDKYANLNASQLAKTSDVTHLQALDTTPWYKKPNLRKLYLTLVPAALGVEMTSGYDGSVLNGLQAVKPWLTCRVSIESLTDIRGISLIATQISIIPKVQFSV